LHGPVMSDFQAQGRQCINDRIHRGDSLCNGIEYIERRKITTVQLAADFARAERNEFVVVHRGFMPEWYCADNAIAVVSSSRWYSVFAGYHSSDGRASLGAIPLAAD
jgi:hypothetical protein